MARRYVVAKEDTGFSWRNLVVWDFIFVALAVGVMVGSRFHIHTVLCFLMGVFAGGVMVALMRKKREFKKVLQLLCSLCWTYNIWGFLEASFGWNKTLAPIWTWVIRIFIFLIVMGLHFVFDPSPIGDKDGGAGTRSGDISGDEYRTSQVMSAEHDSLQKRYNALINDYNESSQLRNEVRGQAIQLISEGKGGAHFTELVQGSDTLWREGSAKMAAYMETLTEKGTVAELSSILEKAEALLRQLKSSTRAVEAERHRVLTEGEAGTAEAGKEKAGAEKPKVAETLADDEALFAGCDSKRSLQKRYKSLMKTFHPDNLGGDETMAVKISAMYEELLKKF